VHLFATSIISLALVTQVGQTQGSDDAAQRLKAMRSLAAGVTMETASGTVHQNLKRLDEPLYRFDDPARRTIDGTMWLWCDSGRPSALMTVTKHPSPEGGHHWLTELTSLAPGPMSATIERIGAWQPSEPGAPTQKCSKAPVPAKDAASRLRQMKDLARQIKAHETSLPRGQVAAERYELRVLPQPVHRYADAKSGLIDGAMFIIAYGRNPEIVMLVEARSEGSSEPAWHCGFARVSVANTHVEFDGKEIWSGGGHPKGSDDAYWLFTRPVLDE
jgi:hypothetical protein